MPVAGVGVTAVAVAAARALESDRPDRLIDDPWARALVTASGVHTPFPERWPQGEVDPIEQSMLLGAAYIGMRTRLIDDDLLAGGLAQVCILGSGLDTRSWRLGWTASTAVFELDSPDVVDFVTDTVDAPAKATRIPIGADVTEPWASTIVSAGYRPGAPTHWVLEGLLPYLSAHDQAGILDDVLSLSAPGSRAVIERAPALTDTPQTRERLQTFALATGIPFDDLLARTDPPDPAAVLRAAGWHAEEVSVEDLERRYGRTLTTERTASDASQRGGFVIAHRP